MRAHESNNVGAERRMSPIRPCFHGTPNIEIRLQGDLGIGYANPEFPEWPVLDGGEVRLNSGIASPVAGLPEGTHRVVLRHIEVFLSSLLNQIVWPEETLAR